MLAPHAAQSVILIKGKCINLLRHAQDCARSRVAGNNNKNYYYVYNNNLLPEAICCLQSRNVVVSEVMVADKYIPCITVINNN